MKPISGIRFAPAPPELCRDGLLGWVTFQLGEGLVVEGVGVRRTLEGKLRLAFPTRTDRYGRKRAVLRPASNEARQEIERAVLDQLDLGGAA